MARNIGNVVNSINELVAELGLEKLGTEGDPGTSHPAKREGEKANIQPATEGARSAENTKDNKEQVTGQSIAEANPADAKKDKAESSAKNITTASFVGEDPKVEQGYGSSVTDPGTTHPAKAEGKTAADLSKCATDVLAEIKKLAETTLSVGSDARSKIASFIEAPEAEKEAAVDAHVAEYLRGYTKSAALVGELTADYLDGMNEALAKQAEGEGAPPPDAAMGGDAGGPPGAGGPPEAGGGGMDEEAAALAQAAAEIAQELGVSPEEVLEAASQELEGGAGGAGGDEGAPPDGGGEEGPPPGLEAQASAEKTAEVNALREKAAKYDAIVAAQEKAAADEHIAGIVAKSMDSALSKFMTEKAAKA